MMNELKFNSQVCTTMEQSQRLLDLGLKPKTADMEIEMFKGDDSISGYVSKGYWDAEISKELIELIPAWSLHRLLLLCDVTTVFTRDTLETAYDDQINVIENLIKNGYFNKEYLKQ